MVLEESVVTGNGQHRYVTRPQWGRFADAEPMGSTHGGVAIDRRGRVYVSTNGERGICVFDTNGTFLKSIAPDCAGTHSLTLREEDGEEYLYGAHLAGQRVVKLDLEGNVVMEIAHSEERPVPGTLRGLTAVAVAPDGRIFAAVGYGSNYIHVFDTDGSLLKTLGGKGEELGLTRTCHGLAIDTRFGEPRLLVADRENRRLVHYDLEGRPLGVYAENLRRPCATSFWGEFCAVAELEGRVTVLDKRGVPVAFLGDNPDVGQWAKFRVPLEEIAPAVFTAPHGLCYGKNGDLFVQDWNATGRLTKLERL